jgi:transposase
LHDCLTGDGIETIVVPPSLIPMESGNRGKTDKRDSRKLAQLLEKGMLKKVYVLSEEERVHRELVRTRRQFIEHRSDVANQEQAFISWYRISLERQAPVDKAIYPVVKRTRMHPQTADDIIGFSD